jgi:phosphomannomutase/phosphoglucomutase
VSNSSLLETETKKWGGEPVMCKVGHSFVEHAMRDHNSLLGGEQSGHFFCGENYFGFDDALVASLRVLSVLHTHQKPVSDLIADFPNVFQALEKRPHCPDSEKSRVIQEVTESFSKNYPVITLDGVRVDFGDGAWAGIRQSNTSPCLSICIEARSEEKLKEVEEIVWSEMKKYPEVEL